MKEIFARLNVTATAIVVAFAAVLTALVVMPVIQTPGYQLFSNEGQFRALFLSVATLFGNDTAPYALASIVQAETEALDEKGRITAAQREAMQSKITELKALAANRGNSDAAVDLGKSLFDMNPYLGIPETANTKRAVQLWESAARVGNCEAMICLALCYRDGAGIERSSAKGVSLLNKVKAMRCGFDDIANQYLADFELEFSKHAPDSIVAYMKENPATPDRKSFETRAMSWGPAAYFQWRLVIKPIPGVDSTRPESAWRNLDGIGLTETPK